jgi:hypothetical protein
MRANIGTLALALALPASGWAQQLLVLPAVTDEQPGLHGSLWVTNVRIVKVNAFDDVVVHRAWLCLEGGGFEDVPGTGPSWMLEGSSARVRVLQGSDLLQGNGTLGAVGLVVEGGEVIAHAYVADARFGDYNDSEQSGDPPGPWVFGQGQLVPAIREPLVGPSHIPWLGGCLNLPCSQDPPERWDYLRNNIGFVNPNPEPMSFVGTVIPFGYSSSGFPGGTIGEIPDDPPETFTSTVPPFGWQQFRWQAHSSYLGNFYVRPPANGFIVSLTPDSELPYYAYASVVFTPDPASGAPQFNDPMFVPAEPGYVMPINEVPAGATRSGAEAKR